MRKHTQGTWNTDGLAVVGDDPYLEICICTSDTDIPKHEAEANASLIAAAPDLLEALKEMYRVCNMSSDDSPHRTKARLAIAKAQGE